MRNNFILMFKTFRFYVFQNIMDILSYFYLRAPYGRSAELARMSAM